MTMLSNFLSFFSPFFLSLSCYFSVSISLCLFLLSLPLCSGMPMLRQEQRVSLLLLGSVGEAGQPAQSNPDPESTWAL